MKAFAVIAAAACALILTGCANRQGVTPSQNPTLQTLSPNTNATSDGGVMQRSLDTWLKEDWAPLTTPKPTPPAVPEQTATAPAAATPASPSAAPSAPDATPASPSAAPEAPAAPAAEDDEPFTLQKYVDKWKLYNENKPTSQDPSHTEKMNSLPAVGK